MESATFRLVAQCVNQLHYRVTILEYEHLRNKLMKRRIYLVLISFLLPHHKFVSHRFPYYPGFVVSFQQRVNIFFPLSKPSRPKLEPTHPPILSASGTLSPGVKRPFPISALSTASKSESEWSYKPTPSYASTTCLL